jgi:hypothetical protein
VETQSDWKTFFNQSVERAIRSVVPEDRVIIDTGDGAAICFLADPESAVLCSLAILNDFKEREGADKNPPRIRLGVHLGPVKLVQDLNGNLNAIGDGINVGQRIMSFADGDQILVSRSYFEVVSRLSDEYSRLFRFEGMRQDKHVREHAIYALVPQLHESAASDEDSQSGPIQVTENAPGPEVPSGFSKEALEIIEECLRESVGPMAVHLVRVEAGKAKTLGDLCQALAEQAVPAHERPKFLQVCRAKLQKVNPGLELKTETATKLSAEVGEQAQKANWDAAFLESLKLRVSENLGPVASIVVDRAAKKAQTREELLAMLAEHFPPEQKRKR